MQSPGERGCSLLMQGNPPSFGFGPENPFAVQRAPLGEEIWLHSDALKTQHVPDANRQMQLSLRPQHVAGGFLHLVLQNQSFNLKQNSASHSELRNLFSFADP
ncbi:unnamed protein product [Eretmochelys imbricata]